MKARIDTINKIYFYNGRFDLTENPKFAWPGCCVRVRFFGTGLKASFNSSGDDYFIIKLDEKIIENRLNIKGDCDVVLCENLPLGEHIVELLKRTEFTRGCTEIKCIEAIDGEILPCAVSHDLRLQFIGDSISAGYGTDSEEFSTQEVVNIPHISFYDNVFDSYCVKTAEKFNAEYQILACSGYGLIRNWNSFPGPCMPEMMEKITPLTKETWDYKKWIPNVVVINLGTNDFSVNFIPDKTSFVSAYIDLINKLKRYYPAIKIIACVGPLVSGQSLVLLREYVTEAVEYFNGDNVYFLEYPTQSWKDGYGLQYHPSKKTHMKMAVLLTEKIKEILSL